MVTWSSKLEIGLEIIDLEHKEIIEEFDRLYVLMRTGQGHDFYRLLLDFLINYVSKHLKHEESLMETIKYDDLNPHKVIHKEFKDKVIDLEVKHRVGKITNEDLIEINLMLRDWMVNHILETDMKVGAFIKKNKIEIASLNLEDD